MKWLGNIILTRLGVEKHFRLLVDSQRKEQSGEILFLLKGRVLWRRKLLFPGDGTHLTLPHMATAGATRVDIRWSGIQ
ncbi:hypothetical protein ACK8P5_26355 (plasmid) [Paenibacillus sp. EC2-1]|uniref:hypothetical protein n=1 Tax=Paenibacillus sp. EC2-1 TaxID=3388665 RepID=UPI003BEF2328